MNPSQGILLIAAIVCMILAASFAQIPDEPQGKGFSFTKKNTPACQDYDADDDFVNVTTNMKTTELFAAGNLFFNVNNSQTIYICRTKLEDDVLGYGYGYKIFNSSGFECIVTINDGSLTSQIVQTNIQFLKRPKKNPVGVPSARLAFYEIPSLLQKPAGVLAYTEIAVDGLTVRSAVKVALDIMGDGVSSYIAKFQEYAGYYGGGWKYNDNLGFFSKSDNAFVYAKAQESDSSQGTTQTTTVPFQRQSLFFLFCISE